jgi:hypothetical protein
MKQQDDKKQAIRLGEQEIRVFLALTSGQDAQVPDYLRTSVCIAVHDWLFPDDPIIPAEAYLDDLLPNLVRVVRWATDMQPRKATAVLARWFGTWKAELARKMKMVDPSLN